MPSGVSHGVDDVVAARLAPGVDRAPTATSPRRAASPANDGSLRHDGSPDDRRGRRAWRSASAPALIVWVTPAVSERRRARPSAGRRGRRGRRRPRPAPRRPRRAARRSGRRSSRCRRRCPPAAKPPAISAGSSLTGPTAGLDAGHLEEVLGERRPRRERGGRSDRGEEHAGRCLRGRRSVDAAGGAISNSSPTGAGPRLPSSGRSAGGGGGCRRASSMFGNSVTPVIGALRRLTSRLAPIAHGGDRAR